jgi:hypothetical protein
MAVDSGPTEIGANGEPRRPYSREIQQGQLAGVGVGSTPGRTQNSGECST